MAGADSYWQIYVGLTTLSLIEKGIPLSLNTHKQNFTLVSDYLIRPQMPLPPHQ